MMTAFADSTRANFSVQGFLDDVVKPDQIDENGFRTSQPTPNLKQSVTAGELHSNKILIENFSPIKHQAIKMITKVLNR